MNQLIPNIQAYIETLEFLKISEERQKILLKLSDYVQQKLQRNEDININFICTHNSRRSQLCQIWASTAAFHFGFDQVRAFSGGTEATAFHSNAIRALESSGFEITKKAEDTNPVYSIRFTLQNDPLSCFSKVYNNPINAAPFAAVLTCSDAEANCPFIPEAEARFAIKYEDPKKADGSAREAQTYAERNRQIACEMFYVFSNVKK